MLNKSFQTGKWVAGILALVAVAALLLAPSCVDAQQVALAPDSLLLAVGDTARVTATVRGAAGPRLSYRGTNATAFTVHRDGRVTARAPGCGYVRVGVVDSVWTRGQVRVCVTAVAPPPVDTVTPPPPPGDTVGATFASDWSHALGSSFEAVTDGGKWPILACGRTYPTVATVVEAAPLGFTLTPHVLRMQQRGPDACAMLQRNDIVPASTTHWGRFYIRNDENGNSGDHPTGYNNAHFNGGAIQAVPLARNSGGPVGTWRVSVGGGAAYPYNKWWSPVLQNGRWYRFEWEMRYLDATRFHFIPRLYDDTGALIADTDDFLQQDYQSPTRSLNLAQWQAAGNAAAVQDVQLARHFGIGHEGTSGAVTLGYWYYARFAMSTAGWLGR